MRYTNVAVIALLIGASTVQSVKTVTKQTFPAPRPIYELLQGSKAGAVQNKADEVSDDDQREEALEEAEKKNALIQEHAGEEKAKIAQKKMQEAEQLMHEANETVEDAHNRLNHVETFYSQRQAKQAQKMAGYFKKSNIYQKYVQE